MTQVEEETVVEPSPGIAAPTAEEKTEKKRSKSTIRFPYTDVRDALAVAKTLKDQFGSKATVDQMAGALNQKVSGAFRSRLAGAQLFGAVVNGQGGVELTDLGRELADERSQKTALVKAFMCVPMYKALYDKFQGQSLPLGPGLEAEIRGLGVVESQADRARQAFLRSAQYANLFWAGQDRLVIPAGVSLDSVARDAPDDKRDEPNQHTNGDDHGGGKDDPLADPMLAGLLRRMLPKEGEEFPAEKRQLFFSALAVNLDVIYGPPTGGSINTDCLSKIYKVETRGAADTSGRDEPPF